MESCWLPEKADDAGLAFQASGDCLSHNLTRIASHTHAAGQTICASSSYGSQSIHAFRSCSKSIRFPEHPCPNHNSLRVTGAHGSQSIHAQIIIPFVFQEPCPNHNSVRVPRAYGSQSIRAEVKGPLKPRRIAFFSGGTAKAGRETHAACCSNVCLQHSSEKTMPFAALRSQVEVLLLE